VADPRRGASFDGERSRHALIFLARERGLLTGALKTFETVRLAQPHRTGREIANCFPLNALRIRARAQKFEIRPVRGGGLPLCRELKFACYSLFRIEPAIVFAQFGGVTRA